MHLSENPIPFDPEPQQPRVDDVRILARKVWGEKVKLHLEKGETSKAWSITIVADGGTPNVLGVTRRRRGDAIAEAYRMVRAMLLGLHVHPIWP